MRRHARGALLLGIFLSTPVGLSAEQTKERLAPPGDCTKEVYRKLNQAVGSACKAQGMRCEKDMTCETLKARWRAFTACMVARQALMDRCFRGGDVDHQAKMDDYLRGRERCHVFLYDQDCDMDDLCGE